MRAKKFLAAAVCAAGLVVANAGVAWAGEVTGPPGTPGVAGSGSGVRTGAPAHANSICASFRPPIIRDLPARLATGRAQEEPTRRTHQVDNTDCWAWRGG
jgi:hypothetical protein